MQKWLAYLKTQLPALAKSYLSGLVAKLLIGVTGFQGWVANFIAKKVIKYLDKEIKKLVNIAFHRIKAEIDNREYRKVVDNPNSTAEENAQAAEDLINGKE